MLPLRCSRPAVSMSMSMSFCPSTMATRSSSCCVALNNMRFIERLQSGSACPDRRRAGSNPASRRQGQRHAAPYCVFTSTLERERWRENCLERAPSERKWTRCRRAHANTASNNGPTRRGSWQPTCIGFRPRALPRQLGARPDGFESRGLAAAGKLAHNARLSRSGVSRLILTSPCPALSAGRLGRTPYFRHRPLRAEGTSKPSVAEARQSNSF
ncbi:exported hypothetical protein [Paraburkholderia sabiae]|nr:exported hypothetical protein [Paraburkholderia sabiae]